MKNSASQPQDLKEGQLWRLNRRYVSIVGLQNLHVYFRLLDSPKQTGERTLTADSDTLSRYLISRQGKLVSAN